MVRRKGYRRRRIRRGRRGGHRRKIHMSPSVVSNDIGGGVYNVRVRL